MSPLSKVLVIDDEKQILSAVKRSLHGYFDAYTAENEKDALSILENNSIDVVISDYNLESSVNGVELLNTVNTRWPYINRIILTGYRTREIVQDAVNKAGVFKFLTKPWDDNELKLVLYAAVKKSEVIKKNLLVLEDIKNKNKNIEAASKILEAELKFKERKLDISKESISSVQNSLDAVNELLERISSGRTFMEIVSSVLGGIKHIVDCDTASIVSLGGGGNTLSVHSDGWNACYNLKESNTLDSVFESLRNNNYSPLILNSIYAKKELKEKLLKNSSVYSVLLYPISIKTSENTPNVFIIVLGRTEKHMFGREDVVKLKDISASLHVTIERLVSVNYMQAGLRQWENAFNAILDPLFILMPDFTIIRVNESIERLTGIKARTMLGERCHRVFKKSDEPCRNCLADKVFTSGKIDSTEGVPCFQNKSITATAYPIADENGFITSVIQYNNDKSPEFKLYKQLIQSEKLAAIGLLASNIAHEINNPLGGILAYAQLIKKDFPEGSPVHNDMSEIESACNRCKNIITNLLDFSRDTSADGKSVVSVKKIIEGTFALLNICVKNHNVQIEADDESLSVLGNAGQLQQVLFNLLTNAVHATPKGGSIKISVKKQDDNNVHIEVVDSGVGIPDDVMPKIFEPFFTTKDKGQGTGLGLFVTHGIISDHGGDIKVKSTKDGGSTFKVTLPVYRENTL
ncbi:MAG: ATP-binding protein [Pseudomonadota bacterium]